VALASLRTVSMSMRPMRPDAPAMAMAIFMACLA
jgi:hypothetical protein